MRIMTDCFCFDKYFKFISFMLNKAIYYLILVGFRSLVAAIYNNTFFFLTIYLESIVLLQFLLKYSNNVAYVLAFLM